MKKALCISALFAFFAADLTVGEFVVATIRADGSTNTWTQADLQDALGLMNRKYWRDMQTESGRKAWHGKQTTRIDEALEIRIYEYEDGFCWTNKWTRPKSAVELAAERAARAAAVEEAKAVGKPSKAAAIYRKRAAAITNKTETVTVEANK